MNDWWLALAGIAAGLLLFWLALVIALFAVRPADLDAREVLALLPHTIVLVRRLAADSALPRGVRVRLVLLLAYLVLPIDLIPDVIPVIGYADDAIIVAVALRSVTRVAGAEALDRHWPGGAGGLADIKRLAGVGPARE